VKKLSMGLVLATVAAAFTAASANATFTCSGTVSDMTINDNVIVPAGANFRLVRDDVNGNIQVQSGGALILLNTDVHGNVQATGARWIRIDNGTRIDGIVQIIRTTGTPPNQTWNTICNSFIGGSLQVTSNSAPFAIGDAVACSAGNTIVGTVQISSNTAKVRISNNTIGGNLQCSGNKPQASGGHNKVSGIKQGEGCS